MILGERRQIQKQKYRNSRLLVAKGKGNGRSRIQRGTGEFLE